MSLDDYMTTQEVAAVWGVTQSAVLKLIQRGQLEADKFGRDYMIKKSVVEEFKRKGAGRPKKTAS
jgi:excisionase family DNA binding protein